jgi:hypothetical protein
MTTFRSSQFFGAGVLAVAVSLVSSLPCAAGEFKIVNYSNQDIIVALGYSNGNGKIVSEGWKLVPNTKSYSQSIPDDGEVYCRVEKVNAIGKDLSFENNHIFNRFPAIILPGVRPTTFGVELSPDDPQVEILKCGNFAPITKIRASGNYPPGWASVRFFKLNPGNKPLEVTPKH